MKKIIIALAFIVSVGVSIAQESTTYKITNVSLLEGSGEYSEWQPAVGTLRTSGRHVDISVTKPRVEVSLTLDVISRTETEDAVLVEYLDVSKSVKVFLYISKESGIVIIQLTGGGSSVRLAIGNKVSTETFKPNYRIL